MRRKELEIKDTKEIEAIINTGKIYRNDLSYKDKTNIVKMNYGDENNTIYFN